MVARHSWGPVGGTSGRSDPHTSQGRLGQQPSDLSIISLCSFRIGGCLTDGKSIEIALEDLTVESIGISKVRTLLADVQVRSLHGGPLAELIIRCLQPLNLRYKIRKSPYLEA